MILGLTWPAEVVGLRESGEVPNDLRSRFTRSKTVFSLTDY